MCVCVCETLDVKVQNASMADGSELPVPSSEITGIFIAVLSSFVNGCTFVLQKKGILRSRDKGRTRTHVRGGQEVETKK